MKDLISSPQNIVVIGDMYVSTDVMVESLEKSKINCGKITQLFWGDYDKTHFAENKKKGIEKMLEYYNMDGYVAFGDSNNDLEMMKGADISICLGQGLETVKKVSTYVTDEVLEDGIYNACKKYKWI